MTETIKVGDLGDIITGNTPPRSKPELYGNYIPFIKATDISESEKHTYSPGECYSEEGYEKYKNSLIPKGATCVVTIGSVGKKMTMAHCDCFINQAMNAIIPNENYDGEYVYYLLKNNLYKLKMLNSGTASGRENVSKSAFSNMELLAVTDKKQQEKIGYVLSTIDGLIENYQKQIKLLEEGAQRLYKEWFIEFRFRGCNNVKIVNGIPNGWIKGELGDLAVDSGKRETKENRDSYNCYLPIDCLPKKSLSYQIVNDVGMAESSLIAFNQGDILFGAMRPYFHKVVVARHAGLTRSTCFVINAKEENTWAYLTMLLFDVNSVDYATQISVGTTMPYVRWNDFVRMPVLIPDSKVCEAFSELVSPMIKDANRLADGVMHLTELRDYLLPKLMSEEIKL